MLGSVDLLLLPYGTALGCYTLWALLNEDGKSCSSNTPIDNYESVRIVNFNCEFQGGPPCPSASRDHIGRSA